MVSRSESQVTMWTCYWYLPGEISWVKSGTGFEFLAYPAKTWRNTQGPKWNSSANTVFSQRSTFGELAGHMEKTISQSLPHTIPEWFPLAYKHAIISDVLTRPPHSPAATSPHHPINGQGKCNMPGDNSDGRSMYKDGDSLMSVLHSNINSCPILRLWLMLSFYFLIICICLGNQGT